MRASVVLSLLFLPLSLAAQSRNLTLDDIYDPVKRISFSGNPQSGFTWLDESRYLVPRRAADRSVIAFEAVDAESGRSVALFDATVLQKELTGIEGVTEEDAKKLARPATPLLSADRKQLLLTVHDDLYLYGLGTAKLRRVTHGAGVEEEASLSPDGSRMAFVRAGDLFVVDLASGTERRLTSDGSADVLNGKLDWVYQEEIYGRGIFRGYWWSPDSASIAFLRLDDRKVPHFQIVDHLPVHQEVDSTPYPKAGDPNPVATLLIADLKDGQLHGLSAKPPADGLIVDVSWKPDSSSVIVQFQDREQTWLDLLAADRRSGAATRILRETTKAWVEPWGSPQYLDDGSFLWLSERSGFRHLYRIAPKGNATQLTRGDWEVRTLHGADQKNGWIYFSATERSSIGLDVYRCHLDGSGMERLTQKSGTHTAAFDPSYRRFLDSWSDVTTPPQTTLDRADGKELRMVDENRVAALAEFRLSKPEFRQVKTRDGFVMEAMILRPPDFNPSRKYPVYQHTYGGPHAQSVLNAWGGSTYLWHQFLAQQGVIVWICDNRTASGKGAVSTWPLYRDFGTSELRDVEDGITWLSSQPGVDASRIMLNGWSYGGFMTSYALTHSTSFKAGIAGGSVTDWNDYDSIYTERYMLTPEHNREGYARSAPRSAAANLHGDLLLLHGTTDDNVHLQNTIQFGYDLQKAGKVFDMMLYARSRHGVTDPALARQMRSTMWRFIQRELLQTQQ